MRVCSTFSDCMYHTTAGKLLDFVKKIFTKDCRCVKGDVRCNNSFSVIHAFEHPLILDFNTFVKSCWF